MLLNPGWKWSENNHHPMSGDELRDKSYARTDNQLYKVSRLARVIDQSQNAEETYQLLTQGVCAHSKWDISSIQVLDVDAGLAVPIVRHDPYYGGDLSKVPGWDARTSPVGHVLQKGEPFIMHDAAAQDDFPGFRDDAMLRGYHTSVMIPLDVTDATGRPIVYSVAAKKVVTVDDADLGFLQCVAELTNIAIRKIQKLDDERLQALRLKTILESMTASLGKTLESEATDALAGGLSKLFPAGWLAIDLTSGRGLFDPSTPPPLPDLSVRRVSDELIRAAIDAGTHASEEPMELRIMGSSIRAEVSALQIDGHHVGTLFFFGNAALNDHERIAAKAGRLALSSFILRSFIEFRSRRVTARRVLARLLSGDWRDREEMFDEAHILDFDLQADMRLVMISLPEGRMVDEGAHSFIQRGAQTILGPTISCVLEEQLVLLLGDAAGKAENGRKAFLSRVRSVLPEKVALVMSDKITDISDLPKARQTGLNTLNVARSMHLDGWISQMNMGELPALMTSAEIGRVQAFQQNTLPEVLRADTRKARVARETIEVFLRSGRRYQEAADTLGIHVTTLRYRLDQLQELHGLNFNDSDKCFEIDLAIRLMKLINYYES
ncbi:helix-turn-helix domain-containing protein [uncultured Ruegeria sp.]|uniref:helix-turn-helix domain-containing protein n=1 Tax=uncultured Ruegeria sp. TaxID=259304 RepID=UPI00263343DD|nr:helix-turn-helix domain-containing protein [uncultured Ruegeria sp.]